MRTLLIFCSSLFLLGFKEGKHCKLSDEIFFPYNKILKKEKNLHMSSSGGAMMGDIQKVNAFYDSTKCLTVDQARKLYVDVIEGYLSCYNQDKRVRPYLHNYPFTVDNVDVMIGFTNEQGKRCEHDFVALMFIGKNHELVYRTYDHEKEVFIPLHKEPYETAREIVMREREMSANQ